MLPRIQKSGRYIQRMNQLVTGVRGRTVPATVAAAIVVAVAVAVAGCGGGANTDNSQSAPTSTATATTVTRPQLPTANSVDRSSGTSGMLAMCQIVFSRDTQTENSYSSSYQRAADLMTPQLRAQLIQPSKNVRPFPQWVQWQQSKAWVQGKCVIAADEHPTDTASAQSRVLAVTAQPYDSSGDALDESEAAVWATATKQGDQWAVSRFDVTLDDSP